MGSADAAVPGSRGQVRLRLVDPAHPQYVNADGRHRILLQRTLESRSDSCSGRNAKANEAL